MVLARYPRYFPKQHKLRTHRVSFKVYSPESLYTSGTFTYKSLAPRTTNIFIIACKPTIMSRGVIGAFRRFFRRSLQKKKQQCFFLIKPNRCLSIKKKNSRMGRGVGSFTRYAFSCKRNQPIIKLVGVGGLRARTFLKFLEGYSGVPFATVPAVEKTTLTGLGLIYAINRV